MINLAVVAICSLNASRLFSLKRLESVGKAANEYETPMIDSGTDWRLIEKEKIEIEPAVIRDAIETRKMVATCVIDKVNVLGREILTTFLIETKSNKRDGLGKRPEVTTNGTCTRAWRRAPITTPIATPIIPSRSAKRIIPTIIPTLYKRGAKA